MKTSPIPSIETPATLTELLVERASGSCSQRGFAFFRGDDCEDAFLSYSDLHFSALAVAEELKRVSANRPSVRRDVPQRVVLLCPPGPGYLKGLFGIFYAGMIAVTAYPPRARRRDQRLDRVISDSGSTIAIVEDSVEQRREPICKSSPELAGVDWLNVDRIVADPTWMALPVIGDAAQTAVLQYTSGSTSQPKGVVLSHQNLIANLQMIYRAFELDNADDDWSVSWLPPFHDMGLIGGLLQPIYAGCSTYVLPPAAFVQQPIRWLQAIAKYGASVSGGPNFAYELCVEKTTEQQRRQLDLSCWTLAFTGAEPIRERTLAKFAEAFAVSNFDPRAFYPCYGLAEATLLVSGGPRFRRWKTEPCLSAVGESETSDGIELVSCGRIAEGLTVRIVDMESAEVVPEGVVGEVWVAGDSVSQGYWNQSELSRQVFQQKLAGETKSFLKTGDLGFIRAGELYITGRCKELIVIRGRNFQPAEIEAAACASSDLCVPNGCAAFEITDQGTTRLVIVQEVDQYNREFLPDVANRIRKQLVDTFELEPHTISLIPKRTLPKTSSGKIMRLEAKQRLLNGNLKSLWLAKLPEVDAQDETVTSEVKKVTKAVDSRELTEWLVQRLARQVQTTASEIDIDRPLSQYGLDSVSAVQIVGEIEQRFGCSLPATVFYDAPTIKAIVALVGNANRESAPLVTGEVAESLPVPMATSTLSDQRRTREMAVVGMACRLPQCDDLDTFWSLLSEGRDAIRLPPQTRLEDLGPELGQRRAGWLEQVDLFDAELFGIAPREAASIDPQHRLLLETTWRALENANLDPWSLRGSKTGVFVGISNSDYERYLTARKPQLSIYDMTGNAASMAAHRISYHFDLHGPSVAVDTACSSSLVALHQAIRAIQAGDCEQAIVAGVNLILSPEVFRTLTDAQMLSPTDLCKTFDAAADGYVRGEGCIALLITSVAQAELRGLSCHAVIKGSAVNQDGTTAGITAPNGESQARLYRQALLGAEVKAEQVQILEAHGTGTSLGDPIEFQSLNLVYGVQRSSAFHCKLGAVKANIGHLEAAAGLASLLKVILQLQHSSVAPHPHLTTVNPLIHLTESTLDIPRKLQPLSNDGPLIAAVSSFGFGGTNAHVILSNESVLQPTPHHFVPRDRTSDALIVLSGSNDSALQASAAQLAKFIADHPHHDVQQFAHSLCWQKASGRSRIAFVDHNLASIGSRLQRFAAQLPTKGLCHGHAITNRAPRVAFLCSDERPLAARFGHELSEFDSTFAHWMQQIAQHVRDELQCSCLRQWTSEKQVVEQNDHHHESCGDHQCEALRLFAIQFAYGKMLAAWGATPDFYAGCGSGEYAAAALADVFSWKTALQLLNARSAADKASVLRSSMLESRDPRGQFFSGKLRRIANDEVVSEEYWLTTAQQPNDLEETSTALRAMHVDAIIEVGGSTEDHRLSQHHELRSTLEMVAGLYVQGIVLQPYSKQRLLPSQQTALPGYPFRQKRYWADAISISNEAIEKKEREKGLEREPSQPPASILTKEFLARITTAASTRHQDVPVDFRQALNALNKFVVQWIEFGLQQTHVAWNPGTTISVRGLQEESNVLPKYARLVTRMLEILQTARRVESVGGNETQSPHERRYRILNATNVSEESLKKAGAQLVEQFPDLKIEANLTQRCGLALASVLQGLTDPLTVLFPDGDGGELQALYESSALASISNSLVAEAVAQLVDLQHKLHPQRPLRILEVGAGTGGTTKHVLEKVQDLVQEYYFTDASGLLVSQASIRFGTSSNIRFQVLDLEHDLANQGIAEESFDIVIAANVLHATKQIRPTLQRIEQCLRSDGYLVALEGVQAQPFLDLVFGLTDGWWCFEDFSLRPEHPLMDCNTWKRVLAESGFGEAESIAYPAWAHQVDDLQAVFVAGSSLQRRDNALERKPTEVLARKELSSPARRSIKPEPAATLSNPWGERFRSAVGPARRSSLEGYFLVSLSQVLGYAPEEIDLDAPVNNLGVDSLMAIQLQNRLNAELNLAVPMVAFLQGKSVRQLMEDALATQTAETKVSAGLSDSRPEESSGTGTETTTSIVSLADAQNPTEVSPESRLSIGQQALWVLHQRSPNSAAYNFAFAARTGQRLDQQALQAACQQLLERHPALRTSYAWHENKPVRTVHPAINVVIRDHDVVGWSEEQLLEFVRSCADEPFNLQAGSVIRFHLLHAGNEDVLAIAMHHIAADLWSMDILIQELQTLYYHSLNGTPADLAPLVESFDSYVRWEHELDTSVEGQRLWKYWQAKLADAPAVLDLPTTYPHPSEQTFNGDSWQWQLSRKSVEALKQIARAEKTTLYTVLLTVYQAFLARICRQDDLLIGTVSTTRARREWEGLVGYFLNHLVLRTQISGSPTFRELLRRTQKDVLESLDHQAYPFARIVEKLRPTRDSSRSPLVQTMFIWDKPRHMGQAQSADASSNGQLQLQPLLMEQRGAAFDLTLIVFELEEDLRLAFRYNTDLFSKEAMQTFAASMQVLIDAIASDPDLHLRHVPICSDQQLRRIEAWNATTRDFDPAQAGYARFRSWVEATPDSIAIVHRDTELTYAQLDERAAALATWMSEQGVRAGDFIAVLMPRAINPVTAILATWRLGCAYIPLDPNHPTARLQTILQAAQPALVLTSDGCDDLGIESPCPMVDIDRLPIIAAKPFPPVACAPQDPAYIIYTSGSTGLPKGVVVPHQGVANLCVALSETFGTTPQDRCLQFASLSFDASVFEIMMAFHAGATLVVLDQHVVRSTTSEIRDAIQQAKISIATLSPSVLAAIPDDGLSDLRIVISAGEACSSVLVNKWGPGRRFFNAYGPTETTVWATVAECFPDGVRPTLGRPIANFAVHIVDQHLQTLPIGVPGELCIAGPGLALEYYERAALTAERFVPNPFSARFDGTCYRSGDLARWTEAGTIEFLGRIDSQVKIHGNRVETEEVAAQLRACDGVLDAYVHVDQSLPVARIVAYVVPRDIAFSGSTDTALQTHDLRQQIARQLPCYMLPVEYCLLERLPFTVNGKVDVSRLPVIERVESTSATVDPDSLSSTEKILLEIWQAVLERKSIGLDQNFFDLGGASLTALQAAEMASQHGLNVSAELMFQHQSIRELANALEGNVTCTTDMFAVTQTTPREFHAAEPVQSKRVRELKMVVESLGTYLPPVERSTAEVIASCRNPLDFPLERMTGIESRHVAGREEFSIDLAERAARKCLQHSSYRVDEIELLIACNISRYDAPDFHIVYEPSTASQLKDRLQLSQALAFDVCNACAGFFTALAVAQAKLLSGEVRNAMIVSGEYITHLTDTAQLEIDGFLDPRLACLTLGDAGAAVIVELREGETGFTSLEMFTKGEHYGLCVAQATDRAHGGAIMLTDAIKASAVTLNYAIDHANKTMAAAKWSPEEIEHVIIHQTSSTTIDGAIDQLNRQFGPSIQAGLKTINNLRHRGNTASTTHWVAIMDLIQNGRLHDGEQVLFSISGSGQTIGTALYRFDDLPSRLLGQQSQQTERTTAVVKPAARLGVKIVAASLAEGDAGPRTNSDCDYQVVKLGASAIEECLLQAGWCKEQVQLLIHAGIYRDQFLSEPAVAAILAGVLDINATARSPVGRETLAFDLADSSRGPLTACSVACSMIEVGMLTRGLVSASEVINPCCGTDPRHLLEFGSALALERTTAEEGFGAFHFTSFPQYQSLLKTHTQFENGVAKLVVKQASGLGEAVLQCIEDSANRTMLATGDSLTDFDRILVVGPSVLKTDSIAEQLKLDPARIITSSETENVFTSGLAAAWKQACNRHAPQRGERWLIIAVGAGIEVGCVDYLH